VEIVKGAQLSWSGGSRFDLSVEWILDLVNKIFSLWLVRS
jgi:hypothetical protein